MTESKHIDIGKINISDSNDLLVQTGGEINISKFEIPQVPCVACGKMHDVVSLMIQFQPIEDAELCVDCYKRAFRLLVDLLKRTEG